MEILKRFSKKHVPATVEIFYGPNQVVDEIDSSHREFCLELLSDMGFKCVSGAVGVGAHEDFTVGLLEREARRESGNIASNERRGDFFAGPDPAIEVGIGIWTVD